MNDKHLAARAKLILHELQMRRATFLHTWMAQYIAECLEMLEKDPTDTAVRDRCAATVARLWQTYVEDRRQSLAHAGDLYRTRARLTDDVLAELRAELSDKADVAKEGPFESSVRLLHLTALEEQVLEVYGASAAFRERLNGNATAREAPTSDPAATISLLAELRKETETSTQRIAAAVFPEFANIEIDDLEAVERSAIRALRTIDHARRQRLGCDTSSTSVNSTSTKKAPSSEKSTRKSMSSKRRGKKK